MKLSQPKSARIINSSRVLCALRTNENLSKAQLSRILKLNKVSCGEIVDSLISEGFVREGAKMEVTNGRRPTSLSLVSDSGYVLALDINDKNFTCALCSLDGKIARMERIPFESQITDEEFCVLVVKSCIKTMKLVPHEKILGIGLTAEKSEKNEGLVRVLEKTTEKSVAWTDLTSALVKAEKTINHEISSKQVLMYLNWSASIGLAIVSNGKVVNANNDFGHVKVSGTGLCQCGEIGCLNAFCSPSVISGKPDIRLKDLWESISDESLSMLAKAIRIAHKVTGASDVIIGGEGSTITDKCLDYIRKQCPGISINHSILGNNAVIMAAAENALDVFFFNSSMLEEMRNWI